MGRQNLYFLKKKHKKKTLQHAFFFKLNDKRLGILAKCLGILPKSSERFFHVDKCLQMFIFNEFSCIYISAGFVFVPRIIFSLRCILRMYVFQDYIYIVKIHFWSKENKSLIFMFFSMIIYSILEIYVV